MTMSEIANEPTEDEIVATEISDEALEAAAFAGHAGVYTQLGLCTLSTCPG
jgi:hypothetical protein